MTRGEFIEELAALLEEPVERMTPEAALADYRNWDSTSALGVMAIIEGSGVQLAQDAVAACRTVQDLFALARVS